ncbi:glutaredoxin domain-containing protein [Hyalangium rubrum]|uniref:Glutaredoxin domain-containing protein n=1 Tax=Hyalangium rubrum TaxID=3103134 RepID=A0ABU5H749_9BACT|nr:glutaredoxin domain-containing protein [Hyalangium sp. s54d21]MDY7229311.1 glutaredoxin domain-containing protein [Hyalangium sp. s54d21]
MHALLIAMVFAASPPLDEAKSHLKAGRIDDVYFALEGQQLPEAEHPAAADVLADAARKALTKKDAVMALQLARMAEKYGKAHAGVLETAARASRALEQFEDAEKYADRWLESAPRSDAGHLFRAELAVEAAEWDVALSHLEAVKGPAAKSAKALELRKRARKEHQEKATGLSTLKDLEKQLARAQEEATKNPSRRTGSRAEARSEGVVIYTTAWCGYCKRAKAWLKARGVAFVERDVEKDPDAAAELANKAAAAKKSPRGVPVIDVKGTLVLGFDEKQLEQLL